MKLKSLFKKQKKVLFHVPFSGNILSTMTNFVNALSKLETNFLLKQINNN